MKSFTVALCLFVLTGCATRSSSPVLLDALASPDGGFEGAVFVADPKESVEPDVVTAEVQVTLEPVSLAELGVPARGYGTEWVLMDRTVQRGPGTTGLVQTTTEPVGWVACGTCSEHWIAGQLGQSGAVVPVQPPQAFVPPHQVTTTRSEIQHPNALEAIARGVIGVVKLAISPVAVLAASTLEVPDALSRATPPEDRFELTREALSWLFPDGPEQPRSVDVTETTEIPGAWRDLPMPTRDDRSLCRAATCQDTIAVLRQPQAPGSWSTSIAENTAPQARRVQYAAEMPLDASGGTAILGVDSFQQAEFRRPEPLPEFAPQDALAAIRARDGAALSVALVEADLTAPLDWSGPPATLLHAAVAMDWSSGVELLLERGADPNAVVGRFGEPPLVYGSPSIQVLLVQAGAIRSLPDLPSEAWAAAPLQPTEHGYAARALAVDHFWSAPATIEHLVPVARSGAMARERLASANDLGSVSLLGLRVALTVDGPRRCGPRIRPGFSVPTRSDIRAAWGRPEQSAREGAVWAAEWPGRLATGEGRTVVRMTDRCAWSPLLGQSRATVHLAMGEPDYRGTTHDIFEAGTGTMWRFDGRCTGNSWDDSYYAGGMAMCRANAAAGSAWVFHYTTDGELHDVERLFRPTMDSP